MSKDKCQTQKSLYLLTRVKREKILLRLLVCWLITLGSLENVQSLLNPRREKYCSLVDYEADDI